MKNLKFKAKNLKPWYKIFNFALLFCTFIFTFYTFQTAYAATEFLTSWKSNSYVPYFYQGKALPSPNSIVTVSFELISNGRPVNLSNRLVRWYIDNNLHQSGVDLKTVSFKTNSIKQGDYQVKISLPKYNNGKDLDEIINIPLAAPEAVIDAPYYNKLVNVGVNLFRGLFYFFNISDLKDISLTWSANGQKTNTTAKAPDILELQVPVATSGGQINIGLTARNNKNGLEFGQASINVTIK